MAKVEISSPPTSPYGAGQLQLQNRVQMTSTLTPVTDDLNTTSPLKLSTSAVQVASTLQITTNSDPYIDAEDGAGNNRFTVGRDPSSQIVNIDFASNPTGGTNMVGGIRTYTDGVNLAQVMSFRKDGCIGVNQTSPTSQFSIKGSGSTSATNALFVQNSSSSALLTVRDDGNTTISGSGNVLTILNTTQSKQFTFTPSYATSAYGGYLTHTDGNITLGANLGTDNNSGLGIILGAPSGTRTALLQVKGTGSTSATTSLLVQNSSGTQLLKVTDDGSVTGAEITSTGTLRAANNKLEVFNSGNQVILRNPALGNYFYIGPSNMCGVDNIFSTPNLIAGSLNIYSGSSYQGSKMVLSNFVGSNTGTNYGLTIESGYTNNGAGGPNYGKQVRFYDNLTPNNIQLDMTFAYVNPTINYQGTSSGAVVGYDFNPTITAVSANTTIRAFQCSTGGVYINTTSYNASAILQADSTTQGLLPPRMTDAQVRAIVSPAIGLMAYNTTLDCPVFYSAAGWRKVSHSVM